MKPLHADPRHINHQHYNPETDDYPDDEQELEEKWIATKGLNQDGSMWLTPRQTRNAERTAAQWLQESAPSFKSNSKSDFNV
jgi:hypothetical protein